MQPRRLAFISLVILGAVTALAMQPWFAVKLEGSNELKVDGLSAYPAIGAALFVDLLAIGLFLYIQSRWGVIFLIAGALALLIALVPSWIVFLGTDPEVVAPVVENSTGIASWLSQLDQVVLSHQTTFYGYAASALAFVFLTVQVFAAFRVAAKVGNKLAITHRKTKSKATVTSQPNEDVAADLWQETTPKHN